MSTTTWGIKVKYDHDADPIHTESFQLTIDSRFTKEDIETMVFHHYKKYRYVSIIVVKL